ncbi:MAG: hypothetical protein B7X31_15080 [Thiomonas sp. 13-66-29]|nr:MAG: hypothetical protein B7X31_15080 [Thiomonas sp. 13-66-29]
MSWVCASRRSSMVSSVSAPRRTDCGPASRSTSPPAPDQTWSPLESGQFVSACIQPPAPAGQTLTAPWNHARRATTLGGAGTASAQARDASPTSASRHKTAPHPGDRARGRAGRWRFMGRSLGRWEISTGSRLSFPPHPRLGEAGRGSFVRRLAPAAHSGKNLDIARAGTPRPLDCEPVGGPSQCRHAMQGHSALRGFPAPLDSDLPCCAQGVQPAPRASSRFASVMSDPVKHSVLCVRFDTSCADCGDPNSQPVQPEEALQRLRAGDAWAALAVSGHDTHELTTWAMRLRHQPSGWLPGVVALLPDVAAPGALAALRAGVDAVLLQGSTAPLIRAQLARLRERVAPQPDGWMVLDDTLALQEQTRQLRVGTQSVELAPQLFHLLWSLAAQRGHVMSPQALRLAMDIPARAHPDTVHTAVGRLRRALRPHGLDVRLQTVHGVGYRWARTEDAGPFAMPD